jgi:DNA invertase Pin-like site-specific DNA recombinase
VVYRLDRLARDLVLQETLMARMRKAGVEVLSVTEPDIDSDDATRVLVRQVLGAIAQYERALIRSRMAAGRAAKMAIGGYAGGRPPFGWRAEGKELVPEEREQQVIALARVLSSEGLSSRQIAARLEEAGHRPKVGQRWSSVQVGRLLRGRSYA